MATITQTSRGDSMDLRRAAMTPDQGPTWKAQAGGGFPFDKLLKNLSDPSDPNNVDFLFRRRMRRDHVISMCLFFIAMPIIQASYYFEASEARAQVAAYKVIQPIYARLVMTLMRSLWAGFSPGCKRFDTIMPPWTYFEDGESKQVWTSKNVAAVIYKPTEPLRPEACMPRWNDSNGSFNGIQYDPRFGPGIFSIDGFKSKTIDLIHADWFVHSKEDEDNRIYGYARICNAAPIHHMYWYIWSLIGRAFENNADPGPVMRYPRDDRESIDENDKKMRNVDRGLFLGSERRSGATLALPSDVYETPTGLSNVSKWGIEYPDHSTDFESIMNWLSFLEAAKFRSLLMPEQSVINGDGNSNSRNVMGVAGDLRDRSQGVLMQWVCEHIENVYLKPWFAMNMPDYQGEIKMKPLGFGQQNEDLVRQFFQLIGQEDWREFGINARRLAEAEGFPMLDPEEQQRQMEEAAKKAQEATQQPPAMAPTQGRRAQVTQTGFVDAHGNPITTYVQLHDPIVISADGDFVSSIFGLQQFEDVAVRSVSRTMFRHVFDYLCTDHDKGIGGDELALNTKLQTDARTIFSRAAKLTCKRVGLADVSTELGEGAVEDLAWIASEACVRVSNFAEAEASTVPVKQFAAQVVRGIVAAVYNRGIVAAGLEHGLTHAQLQDGSLEPLSELRDYEGPLTLLSEPFLVREEPLADELQARYDPESRTILFASNLNGDGPTEEDKLRMKLEVGKLLAV